MPEEETPSGAIAQTQEGHQENHWAIVPAEQHPLDRTPGRLLAGSLFGILQRTDGDDYSENDNSNDVDYNDHSDYTVGK